MSEFYLLVDDPPLWLVTEVPFADQPGKVVERFHDRLAAEFEVMRLNDERRDADA